MHLCRVVVGQIIPLVPYCLKWYNYTQWQLITWEHMDYDMYHSHNSTQHLYKADRIFTNIFPILGFSPNPSSVLRAPVRTLTTVPSSLVRIPPNRHTYSDFLSTQRNLLYQRTGSCSTIETLLICINWNHGSVAKHVKQKWCLILLYSLSSLSKLLLG